MVSIEMLLAFLIGKWAVKQAKLQPINHLEVT